MTQKTCTHLSSSPQGKMPFWRSKWVKWLLFTLGVIILLLVAVTVTSFLMYSHQLRQHLELGEKYLNELNYNAAVIEFTSAIEVAPRSQDAYLGRGDAYLGLTEYENAEADFTVVIELNTDTVDGYVGRSRAHAGQGDQAAAVEDLEMAIANGLDAARAEKIRQEIEKPADPLQADQVRWIMEPTYDYQQVIPLKGSSFSDIPGDYSDGQEAISQYFYEMSFPGYSNLPQYYQVQLADGSWRLYFMLDHTDSGDVTMDSPYDAHCPRYDASGILNYTYFKPNGLLPNLPFPWHLFTILERGGGSMGIYYDAHIQSALAIGMFYGYYTTPVSMAGLHKPYPAGQINTSASELDFNQPLAIAADAENDLYEEFSEMVDPTIQEYPKAYIGTDGQLITDFIYDQAEDFSEGIAACCRNGKWGYIDETGAEITDFVYDGIWPYPGEYDPNLGEYGDFRTEYAAYPCTSDTMVVYKNGQVGLLYRDGSVLIDFGEFENLAPAYNNELWAKQDGLWGLIDLADAKRQTRHSTELTVTATSEVPDPAYQMIDYLQELSPENVPIDYPATDSQLYDYFLTVSADQSTLSNTTMYTGPATSYTVKTTIPVGESVEVYGGTVSTDDWLYISWAERELTNPSATLDFQRYTTTLYYGWVPAQNLTPALDQ